MRKLLKTVVFLSLYSFLFWVGTCVADHHKLDKEVIRFHVVGASDSHEDQKVKLLVRDAILDNLRQGISSTSTTQQAKSYILNHLDELKMVGDQVLAKTGLKETCTVAMTEEGFPTRDYDTFRLPEGVYNSLRVTIGEGTGKNWWCVVFPELCIGVTSDEFKTAAQTGGFPDSLSGALAGEEQYQIRFYFLEMLGKLEKFFRGNN